MTTLETILIIILIYLIIAQIFNFISVGTGGYLVDFEVLICNLLWIFLLPVVIIDRVIKNYKRKDKYNE